LLLNPTVAGSRDGALGQRRLITPRNSEFRTEVKTIEKPADPARFRDLEFKMTEIVFVLNILA